MEKMNQIRILLFFCFLVVAALQDFRTKSVALRVYVVFVIAALIWNMGMALGAADQVSISGRTLSCGIGLCLLLLGWASQGSIGAGDGCFFLVSGLLLDAAQNFWLLCVSIFLCGLSSLGILVRAQLAGQQKAKAETLAFLPFVAAAGVTGILMGIIR